MNYLFPSEEKIFIKRGSTLTIERIYIGPNGVPIPLTDYSLFSQVRNSGLFLVQELTVIIPDQTLSPGHYTLSAGIIINWPLDLLYCDVQIINTLTTDVVYSHTFSIIVLDQITQE